MKTIRYWIDGKYDLPDIELSLQNVEVGYYELIDNKIGYCDHKVVNIVTFRECDTPYIELHIQQHGIALPAGKKQFWEGVMSVSGSLMIVVAYR